MTNNISLYFHIPFCAKKCDYCAFYSLPAQTEEVKTAYYNALLRQLNFFETDKTVSTVYFGGGTPPMLGINRLCGLIEQVKERFILSDNCEITVEVNPGTVDRDSLAQLKASGANRLSVGVQAADDAILRSIGRIHSFALAEQCIHDAREVGFVNISADIIFALPEQSLEQFTDGVRKIIATGVKHISAYSLQLEEDTPLYERAKTLTFPDEDAEEAQYEALCSIMRENGFEHYEVSSFAKPNFESRHNMNYWMCGEYFGFGAGAHSYYREKRFMTKANIGMFIKNSAVSLFEPTDYHCRDIVFKEFAEEERIMLGLRTNRGARIPESAFTVAERIARLGYGKFENGVLVLNSKGFRVSNEIISEILVRDEEY